MENISDEIDLKNPPIYSSSEQWLDALKLLKIMQSDYQGTRSQLDKLSQILAEKEYQVNQYLQYTYALSTGYSNFLLGSYKPEIANNKIGSVVLGQPVIPIIIPKAMQLEIRCLGRFEVTTGSKKVDRWQSVKAKETLQYLMTKPHEPVLKEVITEALWPECSAQAAKNNLKAAVHGLRHTLGNLFPTEDPASLIIFVEGSYMINPEIDINIDIEEFERRFNLGRRLEKEGNLLAANREFEKAETLYRGDYLEDEPYQEWTLLRRERLKDSYLFIIGKLADQAMGKSDWESCILYCQKILEKDSCREDAYQRLICCYSRLGQKNRAIRWYEICRKTLQTELNSAPDFQTASLFERLKKGHNL
jgi:DNA-binding SARP family transcriptional activator